MKLVVTDQIHLSPFVASDKDALVQHLNDRDIYDRTLRIPFPYTAAAADEWFVLADQIASQQGCAVNWAIRTADAALIGGFGFDDFQAGKSHRAEIGYWLARPFWGQGIMTAVVRRMCRHGFDELGLAKITAHVFTFNPPSMRVLAKCGFQEEGLLRKHFQKDGKLIDARLFALLKDEPVNRPS